MIAAGMLYSLAVALMLGCAASAAERLLVMRRWPARQIWGLAMVASLGVVAFTFLKPAHDATLSVSILAGSAAPAQSVPDVHGAAGLSFRLHPSEARFLSWPRWPRLDSILIAMWAGSSLILLSLGVAAWLKIRRLLRDLPLTDLDGETVCVTDQIGPAVFGWPRPRVLMPRWMLQASRSVHSMVLAHEQAHVRARDPLFLMAVQLMVAVAPWNLPLWWQLRRFRFAVEVDCDRRVLESGLDPVEYGEALLAVGQQRSQVPLGAIALTEPTSQLEQRIRIIMLKNPRYPVIACGALLALSSALIVGAAELHAPIKVTASADLRKPPPTDGNSLGRKFEAIVRERYPQLLLSQRVAGVRVVNLLFKEDGTVERSSTEVLAGSPETFRPTEASYATTFNIKPEEVGYVGLQGVKVASTGEEILIAFTERKQPGRPFVSSLVVAPDTRDVDRKIVERYFARELQNGVSSQESLWALFDNGGRLLKTGRVAAGDEPIDRILRARFPGIDTQYVTATPITNPEGHWVNTTDGKPLQLLSIWLKKGSQPPEA